jgi:restriction system protein
MKKKEGTGPVQYLAPLLNALKELGGSGAPDEVVDRIAEDLKLPIEIQNDLLDSGEPRYRNQVRWARMYLVREGYIDSSEHGVWKLTPAGLKTTLSLEASKQIYQKWNQFFAEERRAKSKVTTMPETDSDGTEPSSDGYRSDVIELLRSMSPPGFERFAQLLLRKAGFTQVMVTGKSGDGGIDGYGILQVNELVSFKVLFQCKRYKGSVPAKQIRDFRGALGGRSDKGILLTTGTFTADARKEATRDGVPSIELIDGGKLVEMLCKYNLGLKPMPTFEIDEGFFSQFQA